MRIGKRSDRCGPGCYPNRPTRLHDRIIAWLLGRPDAAVAKLKEAKAILTREEYRVAANMILSRSAAGQK